jgi:APA family basic amino acid/polyamine antiporter
MPDTAALPAPGQNKLLQGLGLLDATMLVAGSMIGSGIFIVSAEIAREVGSAGGLLLVWLITGALTLIGALSYGELAAMMPRAGGQYVYLREAYGPLWGFLYGWTLFLVIETGTIAAVAVAFAKFLGVLWPAISTQKGLLPVSLSAHYAISLSTQQMVAIALILLLTCLNTRGLRLGRLIQNTFTSAKILSLLALVAAGVLFMRNAGVVKDNFSAMWTPRHAVDIQPQLAGVPAVTAATGFGLFIALCVAQVGSLFAAVTWENVTFTAGEMKNPGRNLPLSLLLGAGGVIVLYLLANVSYLCLLPLQGIQNAADDRVGTAAMQMVFGNYGAAIMAAAILISTFGCNNGQILTGARVYYAMAQDGLFFRATGKLNTFRVPAGGLLLQCLWACLLVLPRTRQGLDAAGHETYGSLYNDLLDYVVCTSLLFYILTVAAVFVLRSKKPDAARPYRALGYPWAPALYLVAATLIIAVLVLYRTRTTWPGLLIVLTGVPVYFWWNRRRESFMPPPDSNSARPADANSKAN